MLRPSATRSFFLCQYVLCALLVGLACSCGRATYFFAPVPLAYLAAVPTAPRPAFADSSAGRGATRPSSPATATGPCSQARSVQRRTVGPAPAPRLPAPTTLAPSRAGALAARLLTKRLLRGKLQHQPTARVQHQARLTGSSIAGLALLAGGGLLVAIAVAVSTSLVGAVLGTLLLLAGVILALTGLVLLVVGASQ